MKIIAVLNRKGGVGKTTIAQQIALRLAGGWVDTIAVDLDPQASLSSIIPHEDTDGDGGDVVDLWGGVLSFRPTPLDNLGLVCGSGDTMAVAGDDLERAIGALSLLRGVDGRAVAILDCPPAPGVLQDAALCVADIVVVPMEPTLLSIVGVAAIRDQIARILPINSRLVSRFVVNRFRGQCRAHHETLHVLKSRLGDVGVLHERAAVQDATQNFKPVQEWAGVIDNLVNGV